MTATAFLAVSPDTDGSMAPEVAKAVDALESFDVEYETTPMGTILEADDVAVVFEAAAAAHEAVGGDAAARSNTPSLCQSPSIPLDRRKTDGGWLRTGTRWIGTARTSRMGASTSVSRTAGSKSATLGTCSQR
ncbi:hypothetical protein BRC87_13945 [Halobacteriales archaeon QS_4_66_20]|nr:MAG: hypothetical protein BRC87_13945 [Halobacteriales archaeon QS_4_66_20]